MECASFGELLASQRSAPAQLGVWRINWQAFLKRLPAGQLPPFLSALFASLPCRPRVRRR